jgi:DNA polymerase-3 subunit chi
MTPARFYHLTGEGPEAVLRLLVGKSLEAGLRVALRGRDRARMEALDAALWSPPESFVPHALAGEAQDAQQPCLLLDDARPLGEIANRPDCLITLDGAEVRADEAAAVARLCIVFDGTDPDRLEAARAQWRALTGAGVAAEYWRRDGGGWTLAARHPKDA